MSVLSKVRPIDVLLIEDNPTDVLLTREYLEHEHEFRVEDADRLTKALERLETNSYDVVLLDLGLPDSQGLETLLELRKSIPDVPIVVLTGRDDEEVAIRAVHLGAQDYLVKSLVNDQMLERAVRYAIERNQVEDALRERAVLATFTADVGIAFTQGGTLRQMLQRCAESMVANLGAAFARIWTLDEVTDVLELQASAGMYTHLDGPHSRVPVGELKIGLIASEKRPHLTNDVPNDPRVSDPEWARREGMVAFAGYPLLLEDRLVGVMAMFARRPISRTTLEAMQAVSNHVALGIERRQTEETLREVNQTLESLIDTAPVAIAVVDVGGRVLRWNSMAEVMFGWPQEEVIGRPWPIVPEEYRDAYLEIFECELAGEPQAGQEVRRHRKDGTPIHVARWTAPMYDDRGRIVSVLRIFVDMTARKQLEEQLRQAQKMEAIGSLAGGVAHDFNNLLTIITGYSAMLRRKFGTDVAALEYVDEISHAGERASGLTRQLLAFSRKQVLEPKVLDLNQLVTNLEKMLRRLIGEDILLLSVLAPGLGTTRADEGQVEQVIVNLVVNARDAMPRGGRLTIETRNVTLDETYTRAHSDLEPGPYVLVSVSDTGSGMDEATRLRVFEPFFTTKGLGKGTGLGLSTVYGIVKQSGGHIAVYSEPGHGTSFKVYLPRFDELVRAVREAVDAETPHGSETVLLVEDEEALRALTRRILEQYGYEVLEAGDGEEALEVAAGYGGRIHLLLTDVVMPRMSGSQLAERLVGARPGICVLFLSGYTDDAVVRHGILSADVAFLQKPFMPSELLAKVRGVLDESKEKA